MPMRQYFLWVGSVLLLALFVADWLLPEPVAHPHSQIPPHERVNLQIRSNHKWPERVVLDTTHPGHSFAAEAYPEPNLVQPQDLAVMEHRQRLTAQAGTAPDRAPAATSDKASAIPEKPGSETFRMTGTIKAD
jgi:hypothetical protein